MRDLQNSSFASLTWTVALALGVTLVGCGNESEPKNGASETGGSSSGGSATGGSSSGGSASGGSASGGSASGGSASGGSTGCSATSLVGTWEIIEAGATSPTGVITVGESALDVQFENAHLSYKNEGGVLSVSWDGPRTVGAQPVTATHAPQALNTGALGLALGGSWTFDANDGSGESCSATVSATTFMAECNGVVPPSQLPRADGTVAGMRAEARASIFGDLGGVWNVKTPNGNCIVAFVDNHFTVDCEADPTLGGTAEMTFCDNLASGSTSDGVEFSAHKVE
jgi:hypothetical protein